MKNRNFFFAAALFALVFFPQAPALASKTSAVQSLYTWTTVPFCEDYAGHTKDSYYASFMYEAALYKGGTEIADGSSVFVGDTLSLSPIFRDTNISWYSTGSWYNTPYGFWRPGASWSGVLDPNTTQACIPADGAAYFGVSMNLTTPTLSVSGPCSVSGLTCTVTGPGAITLTLNYPTGQYKYWYNEGDTTTAYEVWPLTSGYVAPGASIGFSVNAISAACYPNPEPAGYGTSCTSSANACGQTNTGTIQCNGTCSATTPANPAGYGTACTSAANACGQTQSNGTIQCNGSCSSTPPALPAGYGTACTSAANACGQTSSGTIQCDGSCSATTPANPAGYGTACTSAANACGQTQSNGTIQCNGSCSSTPPALPAGYGTACTSAANACGQTQSNGTIQCNGSCSSTPPSNASCDPDLTAGDTTAASAWTTGQSQGLSANVSNIGIGSASNFPNIFQIANSAITATITMLNAGTVATLAPGASAGISSPYSFSSAGTYNIRACANFNTSWGGSVPESNSGNNCGAWFVVTVSDPSCTNGANNPPACTQCPNGEVYDASSNSCIVCSNGGCTGPGGSTTNPGGSVSCNNGATNPPSCILAPTASLSADDNFVDQGQSTMLRWGSSGNVTSCAFVGTPTNGISTGNAVSGAVSTGALTVPRTEDYLLTCSGPGGTSAPAHASVTVLAPDATISANPMRVQSGNASTISWSANGVNSCVVTGPTGTLASGPSDANRDFTTGSPQSIPILTQSTFTITCQTNGSPVTKSVTVDVGLIFQEF